MDQSNISPAAARDINRLRARLAEREALGVPPATAERLLGISHKKIYELLSGGELDSYKIGRARRVTLASIEGFLARQIEAHPMPRTRRPRG